MNLDGFIYIEVGVLTNLVGVNWTLNSLSIYLQVKLVFIGGHRL